MNIFGFEIKRTERPTPADLALEAEKERRERAGSLSDAGWTEATHAYYGPTESGERITCLVVRARRTVPGDPIPRARLLVEVECLVWAPAAD